MNNPEFNATIFVIGCIGALAPEMVRLYNLRNNPRFRWSWFYLVISGCFALLGGLIAWILPTTTYYGAFYAGVATPVIVTTILRERKPAVPRPVNREELRDVLKEIVQASIKPREAQETQRLETRRETAERETMREPTLSEVIDRILEKGTEIDAWTRVSLVGIEALLREERKGKVSHLLHDYFQAL